MRHRSPVPGPSARILATNIFLATLGMTAGSASGQFSGYDELTDTILSPRGIQCGDMDGDGDQDVFVISLFSGDVTVFENLGSGAFGPKQVIDSTPQFAQDLSVVDLDADGALDVLVASSGDDSVRRYMGGGDGTFGPGMVVTSDVEGARTVDTADFDGDGDLDIVCGSLFDGLFWQEQLPIGYGPLTPIGTPFQMLFLRVGDIDGDGLPDIAYSTNTSQSIAWRRGLGSGNFGPEIVLATGTQNCNDIQPADLDSDGDLDIVLAVAGGSQPDSYGWLENLGGGSFAPYHVFTDTANRPEGVEVADLDGDGDLDVIGVSVNDSRLSWFQNLGAGLFMSEQVLANPFIPRTLAACDITGDGAVDIIAGGSAGTLPVYAAVGPPSLVETIEPIGTSAEDVTSVASADLDGDGDADVISASPGDNKLAIYENLGDGAFGPQTVVDSTGDGPSRVVAGDLDGDGDTDLLVATLQNTTLVWYAGDGSGQFALPVTISTFPSSLRDIEIADLDLDGDLDIVTVYGFQSIIEVLGNQGSGTFLPAGQVLGANNSSSLALGDINGDGYIDIAASAFNSLRIVWFRNRQNLDFGMVQVASGIIDEPIDVALLDVDLDGDLDTLWSSSFTNSSHWCENLGNGNFGSNQPNGAPSFDGGRIRAADLDADGDDDILIAQGFFGGNGILWAENLGGTFGALETVSLLDSAVLAIPADLDGDGDLDVLAGSNDNGSVGWFEASILSVVGSPYCLPAVPNSTGQFGTALVTGSPAVADDELVLHATQLPPDNFGLFLASPNQAQTPIAGSQGILCLGASIGRFNAPGQIQLIGQAGTVVLDIGTQAVATPSGPQPIQPGETWNFQLWYRDNDPGPTSNLTGGVSVTFP